MSTSAVGDDPFSVPGSQRLVGLRRRPIESSDWPSRPTLIFALILWAVAILHPPHGLDLPICWWKATTGLPCPGCGLMRSVSCTARGMFAEAWNYHPFGPIWLAVATAGAATYLLPRSARRRLNLALTRHRRLAHAAYAALVAAFLGYGTLRALGCLATLETAFRHT